MVAIEVVIIGALVVFMLAVAIIPALVRSMQGNQTKKAKKAKRGVTKSQMCLQPGCVRCAFSTDPASLQAFKRHLWESFRALAAASHLAQDDERANIHSRIGPAVKRLVTSPSSGGAGDAPPALLPIEGLSPIDDARRLAWVDQLVPAIPRMAAEARRAWSERAAAAATAAAEASATTATAATAGESGGRWRRQEAAGECVGWKWDLWNQGTLVEAHAQRAPETVQLLEQHAADSLMDCAFGFAYFLVLEEQETKSPSATSPADDDLVGTPDHDQAESDQGLRQRATAKKAKNEERSGKNESDAVAARPNGQEPASRRSIGPTNARLRCRFVLATPGTLSVTEAETKWEAGTCLVSNDPRPHELRVERSSASAEATQDDDGKPIALALVVDVWHPDLAPIERQALSKLFPASSDASSSALVD